MKTFLVYPLRRNGELSADLGCDPSERIAHHAVYLDGHRLPPGESWITDTRIYFTERVPESAEVIVDVEFRPLSFIPR